MYNYRMHFFKSIFFSILSLFIIVGGLYFYLSNDQVSVVDETASTNDTVKEISSANNHSSEVLNEWIDLFLLLSKDTPGFSPPVAARAFGYTSVSLYESVRFGIPGSESLAGQVNGFDESLLENVNTASIYDWRIVANANLAASARAYYFNTSDNYKNRIDQLEQTLLEKYSQGAEESVINDSISLGLQVAELIEQYADSDGQREAYSFNFPADFQPLTGEVLWVPTPADYQKAMQPYWGEVRPFITANVEGTIPPPPPKYSLEEDSKFFIETKEVYDAVTNLTEEERTIAEFWSDDPGLTPTPPGHSVSILNQILKQENSTLDESVVAFAKVGMGVHDAFISCWNSKYIYNYIRPITVIREHIDPEFEIPLNTPPFPEYPSGHSVQSGATAQILADIFGENYNFTDFTHENRADIDFSPRTFNSFSEFADEAAISRLYGGIHFRSAIELGVDQGRKIANNIDKISFID